MAALEGKVVVSDEKGDETAVDRARGVVGATTVEAAARVVVGEITGEAVVGEVACIASSFLN